MSTPLDRDAKPCLERWKNYLSNLASRRDPLLKKSGVLSSIFTPNTATNGKKIAAEVPGRTAKRLGKWWEVFKEKQQREQNENNKAVEPIEEGKYDRILENFAEKLVKERSSPAFLMATSNNGGFLHTHQPPPAPTLLPPRLSNSNGTSTVRAPSPSVTLSLSTTTVPGLAASPPKPWLHLERGPENTPLPRGSMAPHVSVPACGENLLITELLECCGELEERHRAWAAHKKEAAWRSRRVELQLESEKSCKRREKMEETESNVKALSRVQGTVNWIEEGCRSQGAEAGRAVGCKALASYQVS